MKKNLAAACAFALFILAAGTGCEAFKEAWEEAVTYEDTPEEVEAEEHAGGTR